MTVDKNTEYNFEDHSWDIEFKWRADDHLFLYPFCYEILESATEEVREWLRPCKNESFELVVFSRIEEVKSHLITAHIMLFKEPAFDILKEYQRLLDVVEFFNYLYARIPNKEMHKSIKAIMARVRGIRSHYLSENETLALLYCKSIISYGILCHHRNKSAFDRKVNTELNACWAFCTKHIKEINNLYDSYSDEIKDKKDEVIEISFKGELERKQAIIYFTTVNSLILDKGIFTDEDMFNIFIECLESGCMESECKFALNPFYSKKLLVKVIDNAKVLFKRTGKMGPYYFIKNTRQFKYEETPIDGNNWHTNEVINISEESQLFEKSKEKLVQIKKMEKRSLESIFYNTKIST